MADWWCDAKDKSKTARDESSSTAVCIPFAKDTADMKSVLAAHISQTPFITTATATFLLSFLLRCHFIQTHKHARLGPTSPGHNRLVCQIHTPYNVSKLNNRYDLPTIVGRGQNIMDNNDENIEQKKIFHETIVRYLVEVLDMDPKDEEFMHYHSYFWLFNSGMGYHADSAGLKHKNMFFLRFSIQLGAARTVSFKAYKLEDKKDVRVFPDVNLPSIKLRAGADAYVMSAYASGVHPASWADKKKEVGYLIKHQVERIKTEENAMNIILDVPFSSLQAMSKALIIFKKFPLILPTKDGMDDYKLLLSEVAKFHNAWKDAGK